MPDEIKYHEMINAIFSDPDGNRLNLPPSAVDFPAPSTYKMPSPNGVLLFHLYRYIKSMTDGSKVVEYKQSSLTPAAKMPPEPVGGKVPK